MAVLTRPKSKKKSAKKPVVVAASLASRLHREAEAPDRGASQEQGEAPDLGRHRMTAEAPDAGDGRSAFVEHEFTHGRSQG